MDVVNLSRLQFAGTIMFHYLFPPLTIGISVVIVYLEGMFLRTRDPLYETAARFWTRIFALNFAVGVATGVVMEFEFGTNWAAYSRFVGDVFGSALAAEGIFAFFLESGFLAILVFGWERVGPGMHFFASLMVSLGSIFSAVWIIVANSWQQTPAGHHIVPILRDGKPWIIHGEPMLRAEITDFWALVFNPSTVHRLTHVLIGAMIMGTFLVMSVSAWYLLRGKHGEFARRSFSGALLLGTLASIAALISGDLQSKNVYKEQPAKLAAFEAHFTTGPADLALFGVPDERAGKLKAAIVAPGVLSWLLEGQSGAPILGLDSFRPEHRPPVGIPFFSYRVMVGCGFFFIAATLLASFLRWRGRLFETRWLLWVFVFAVLPAVAANQAGWVAAEVGRQPWIVNPPIVRDSSGAPARDADGFIRYATTMTEMPDGSTHETWAGLMTTEGVSEAVSASQVVGSIVMFGLIYALLGAMWVFVLNRKIQEGPAVAEHPPTRSGVIGTASARVDHTAAMTGKE